MNTLLLDLGRIALVGIGATVVMDLWLALLRRLGVPTLDFALLGRWAGHLAGGRFRHDGIAKSPRIRNEVALGWLVHYAVGIAFAGLLAAIVGMAWLQSPTVLPALAIGAATVAAPLFVMQPSMGAGIASSRTAAPLTNCLRSLANHTVFGAGLYVAAVTIQQVAA
jgi:energy-converting hydrogenase Eha subunit B